MEVPYTPENDELADKVDRLFLKYDLGYYAIMSEVLERTHQKETDPQEFA